MFFQCLFSKGVVKTGAHSQLHCLRLTLCQEDDWKKKIGWKGFKRWEVNHQQLFQQVEKQQSDEHGFPKSLILLQRGKKHSVLFYTCFVQLSLDERPSFLDEEKLPELRVNCFWIVHSVTCRETQRSARGRRLYCLTFIPHWLQAESGICTLTFLSFSLLAFHFSVYFPRISSMFLDSSQKVRTEP